MLKAVNGCHQTLVWSTDRSRSPLSCASAAQGTGVSHFSLPSFPIFLQSGTGLQHALAFSNGFGGSKHTILQRKKHPRVEKRLYDVSLKTWGFGSGEGFGELGRTRPAWEGLTAEAADRAPCPPGVSCALGGCAEEGGIWWPGPLLSLEGLNMPWRGVGGGGGRITLFQEKKHFL